MNDESESSSYEHEHEQRSAKRLRASPLGGGGAVCLHGDVDQPPLQVWRVVSSGNVGIKVIRG